MLVAWQTHWYMEPAASSQNQQQLCPTHCILFPLLPKSQAFYKSIPHLPFFPSTKKRKKPSRQQTKKSSLLLLPLFLQPANKEAAMASTSRASWIVATTISAVETLKDQGGLCRWNYAMSSLHQSARKEMASFSQTRKTPSSSSSSLMVASRGVATKAEQAKRADESFRKVMYLSCWGPN